MSEVSADAQEMKTKPKPFLKWAGGKGVLLPTLAEFVPARFNKYIEPFLGGGAFFFDLAPKKALLADSNPELTNCFQAVKSTPHALIAALGGLRNSKEDFIRIRSQDPKRLTAVQRAARFIYLNKTCFNGLYRVNKKGQFNTPYSNNPNGRFLDEATLLAASKALKSAKICCGDFGEVLRKEAKRNNFIYLDPPYMPISDFSDFQRYTPNQFHESDHIRLAELFRELDAKGCFILLSNSYHPKIKELYEGFNSVTVTAPRSINCKGNKRGHVKELLIRNF